MKQNKIYAMIGLAERARKAASGEFMTEKAVKDGSASLVVIGCDASDNTKKNFTDMCRFYHVPYYFYGTKEELGHAMGKQMRASLAIRDEGFARNLIRLLEAEQTQEGILNAAAKEEIE